MRESKHYAGGPDSEQRHDQGGQNAQYLHRRFGSLGVSCPDGEEFPRSRVGAVPIGHAIWKVGLAFQRSMDKTARNSS
jgi:hypothetical protein